MEEVFLKMLVHGASGAGKTTLIGSCAKDERFYPALLIDSDGSTASIRSKLNRVENASELSAEETPIGKIDTLRIRTWKEFEKAISAVREQGYKTLLVDSLSEFHAINMQDIIKSPSYGKHNGVTPEMTDWGKALYRLTAFVKAFTLEAVDCHIVMTCASHSKVNPKTKMMRSEPMLQGSIGNSLPYWFDQICYLGMDDETGERIGLFDHNSYYIAKERAEFPQLSTGEVINPTLSQILDAVEKSYKLALEV